ncbi:hypothetical protein GCM10025869_19680 [Homoserinibacter gongjuensis]|uniref:Bacterial Ig-like domain-containing protein n=1 Tax=Homoserinibacter gongjuensis TaxID=1162968 RepID=A0ABQ6JTX7_9MICO|nr:hypothetical protein GCM10025869_19680 [Homoserinibacter gongjuensis]
MSVTASYSGATDGAYRASPVSSAHEVEIAGGPAVALTFVPAAPTVAVGDPVTLLVTGEDAFGTDLGDLTADVSFSIGGVPFVNGSVLPAGTHTITATLTSNPAVTADAVVTVVAAGPAAIPDTGIDAAGPMLAAVVLLALGGVLIGIRVRRAARPATR